MKQIKMNTQLPATENRVSDLYVAAFLLANGAELISVDKSDRKRAVFIFGNSEDSEKLLADFWLKRASIEPRAFIAAIKEAKELIYS